MKQILLIYILALLPYLISASDTLSLSQFQEIVLKNHPLIKSAKIYDAIAESYLIKGQGSLDPKFYSNFDEKQFKNQNYFRRWNSEVKIPTRYPVDISLGYENNSGNFLNNENNLPSYGLLYGNINITLLRGLLFDQQRFALKESQLLADKSKVEKELIVRNIITQAFNAYVNWSAAHRELEIVQSYQERVTDRHNFIKQLFENGDKPAIDTMESRINLNTATKARITALENLLLKKQKLNMFLWDNEGTPLALLQTVIPQDISEVNEVLLELSLIIAQNWNTDLIIRKKQIELEQINLENRLEKEQLKPQLDIKLNTIHSLGETALDYSYSINDYKVGAFFIMPIRNRKTKGQIQLNEALIDQNKLDQNYYQLELQNMYQTLNNTAALNRASLKISVEKVNNSSVLYSTEQLKFDLGESSVFLLNNREMKLLEAQREYLKTVKALCLIYNDLYFLKLGQKKPLNPEDILN